MRLVLVMAVITLAACEHGKGGGIGGACAGLSLGDCRQTPGCRADTCAGCFCDVSYQGCAVDTAPRPNCPLLDCPSAECCSTGDECTNGTSCAPPGTPPGCGICDPSPGDCTTDDQCTGTQICEPITCSCEGASQCVPGCLADADCTDEGTTCDLASSRCVPAPCTTDDDCPQAFECAGSVCARQSCVDDLDCDGFCVVGQCFATGRGECIPPAA